MAPAQHRAAVGGHEAAQVGVAKALGHHLPVGLRVYALVRDRQWFAERRILFGGALLLRLGLDHGLGRCLRNGEDGPEMSVVWGYPLWGNGDCVEGLCWVGNVPQTGSPSSNIVFLMEPRALIDNR